MVVVVWHKLLHPFGGRPAWARNVQVVSNKCYRVACPGKPLMLQGWVQRELLWYAPADVMRTVHASACGTPLPLPSEKKCTACNR